MKKLLRLILPVSARAQLRHGFVKVIGGMPFGNKVFCNVCKHRSWRFFRFRSRPNAMCSKCFSLERHRLLFELIENEFPAMLNDQCRILHFAAEACLHNQIAKNEKADYHTADNMSQFIHGVEIKPKHCMDITDIKFEDDSFDYIICNHVLEHVPDDRKAMSELYRVLRPGGVGLINIPARKNETETLDDPTLTPEQRRKHYGAQDHLRYYANPDFANRLQSVGFTTVIRDYGTETSLDPIKNRIMTHEQIVISRKPESKS